MGFLDILLGRQRPVRTKLESLFAISTAEITLETRADLRPASRAGICFRPVASSRFRNMQKELEELIALSGRSTNTKVRVQDDSFGFQWVVLEDDEFEDLVATIHMVSLTLHEQSFGEQLLAAVFKFVDRVNREGGEQAVYWIYNYKRGMFYPFVPTAQRERDNARELELRSLMERELPIEAELERWYALWGLPF